MDHPLYKVKLKTVQRDAGTWAVENGDLVFMIPLDNNVSSRVCYKIERVSSSELVLTEKGTAGKEEIFRRKG